ncbi:hypothetical protein HCN51_45890 [Nonomuraea sp. FMUSA5-5]|uniref:Uncharacterized protein n=1 Tax=Nonomuraea composti TaxID=2720023 RepID=A0ABX1BJK0_9ACTN|nr:hypothetical protein [Nonomuraea sp. FMUSA5-5]NJP96682.1 hypothetical protein [Nonomuraea sp. FMUSA5-5]
MAAASRELAPIWSPRLLRTTFACSFVFALTTLVYGWLATSPETTALALRLAGKSAAEAPAALPELLTNLRAVIAIGVLGNVLGMFALRGTTWSYWAALLVNLTQASALPGLVPGQVHQAALQRYGLPGLLPIVVTGGGAVLLTCALIAQLVSVRDVRAGA